MNKSYIFGNIVILIVAICPMIEMSSVIQWFMYSSIVFSSAIKLRSDSMGEICMPRYVMFPVVRGI